MKKNEGRGLPTLSSTQVRPSNLFKWIDMEVHAPLKGRGLSEVLFSFEFKFLVVLSRENKSLLAHVFIIDDVGTVRAVIFTSLS